MLPSHRDPKSASEYPKSLSNWLELDYFRRPRRLRRVRRLVTWSVLVVSAAWIAAVTWLPGNRQVYQAASVSTAHALFNNDCEACHDATFGTGKRLFHGDDELRSVTDEACLRCHAGDTHHGRQIGQSACVKCHHEHRGRIDMARVENGHCVNCHADLKRHTDATKPGDADRPFRDVTAFLGGSHPHPKFFLTDNPRDDGTIRFNHQAHMNPQGLLVAGSLERRTLRCTDCHQTDPAGRYMEPISYQKHCRDCHPLNVQVFGKIDEIAAQEEAERFRTKPAAHPIDPNEGLETVRAVLRDRFLQFAFQYPSVHAKASRTDLERPRPGLPRLDPTTPTTTARSAADWAEQQLRESTRLLFNGAGGCRYCHQVTPGASHNGNGDGGAAGTPRFEPPRIASRWFSHSIFSHERHRSLDCRQCHERATESRLTSDVLMPTIESCQKCHNGTPQGARTDCVECHVYHTPHQLRDSPRDLAIEDFLRGRGAQAPKPARPAHPAAGR